jgi:cell wall-associated NlpC family hydrolase
MTKYFTNTFSLLNVYKKPLIKSEIVTQIIYGESFKIIKKNKKWLSIKIKEDNYKGFIKEKKFKAFIKPTHKVSNLQANVYQHPNKKKIINKLTFGSKIKIIEKKSNLMKFDKGWVNKKDVRPIFFIERNYFKHINLFKNIKYKWGGKSFKGIDCSGLIQVCLNFNNKYCPRDTNEQIKYFKKNIKLDKIKKNDVIYWKGHVAVALTNKKLIHAYGPKKKAIIMNIDKTLEIIKKTANLKVISIKRI